MYFQAWGKISVFCLHNEQRFHFTVDRSELPLSLYSISGIGSDIHRLPAGSKEKSHKWQKTNMLLLIGTIENSQKLMLFPQCVMGHTYRQQTAMLQTGKPESGQWLLTSSFFLFLAKSFHEWLPLNSINCHNVQKRDSYEGPLTHSSKFVEKNSPLRSSNRIKCSQWKQVPILSEQTNWILHFTEDLLLIHIYEKASLVKCVKYYFEYSKNDTIFPFYYVHLKKYICEQNLKSNKIKYFESR